MLSNKMKMAMQRRIVGNWSEKRRAIGIVRWEAAPCSSLLSSSSLLHQRKLSSARPLREDQIESEDWDSPHRRPHRPPSHHPQQPQTQSLQRPLKSLRRTDAANEFALLHKTKKAVTPATDTLPSPQHLTYTGGRTIPVTSQLHIYTPEEGPPVGTWPVFRLMDESGHFRPEPGDTTSHSLTPTTAVANRDLATLMSTLQQWHPHFQEELEKNALLHSSPLPYPDTDSNNTLLRAHRQMIRLREMDNILHNAQRQGRISFYITCTGEEAIHIGAAAALDLQDPILAQYREAGLLMWRGFTLEQFTDQCFSNKSDLGKGRQMPVHYGSRALNYHTISSPLGTQLPHAVGVAYRLKLAKKPNVAVCFFGDGCASTTDFHSALNFAATLHAPVVFFCRNNGYAISTPVTDQYAGDGIVSRGPGYGMAAIRVDGNDIFAVSAVMREAKAYALANQAPVLVEAMTYRRGHHSTSDDSTRYRDPSELNDFAEKRDPIDRLEKLMKLHGWMDDTEAASIHAAEKAAVLRAMEQAERKPKPPLEELFQDVYYDMPPRLREQEQQLHQHLKKYPDKY